MAASEAETFLGSSNAGSESDEQLAEGLTAK
jgi:hypothetical protein